MIYIHCQFSSPVLPLQTWGRSLCTDSATDSLSSLPYETQAVNIKDSSILLLVPEEEKKLRVYVWNVHDVSLHVSELRFTLHMQPAV